MGILPCTNPVLKNAKANKRLATTIFVSTVNSADMIPIIVNWNLKRHKL